jgi:arylsulfatase A-like enzyme
LRGGKGYQWEGGIRVPYFIYVPWLNSNGARNNTPVIGADFYPTILELAGIELKNNANIDGASLMPLLTGDHFKSRPLFWHYPHYGNQGGEPSSIIRENDWKLIHYWEDGHDELYNLSIDVSEKMNIADKHPEIVSKMKGQLMEWLKSYSAKLPMTDPLFNKDSLNIKLQYYKNIELPYLEKNRKLSLMKDWQPNKDWWGSQKSNE